jgi:FKBP-type peptidyl-prolyl cis-trans isomerase FkpA
MRKLSQIGLALAGLAVLLTGCDSKEYKTLESGLQYKYFEEGEGPAPNEGDFMILNMDYYLDKNDSLLFSSQDRPFPLAVPYQDSVWRSSKGELQEGFHMLKKGDSVGFKLSADKFFGRMLPPSINKEEVIRVNVGVKNVMDPQAYREFEQEIMQKQQEERMAQMEEQHATDVEKIEAYLKENNIEAQKTEDGLFYVIREEGKGKEAENGKLVHVHYTGKTLAGEKFDSSLDREPVEPFAFVLGQGRVIRGWDQGIALLQEGDKATLYIPSTMAYGPRGAGGGVIGPNEILIFDVELVKVEEPK